MPFVENLAPFFSTDEFASDATLNGVAVRGIFDAKPVVSFDEVGGNNPVFTLPSADVPTDPRGLTLAITGGASFKVRDWDADGTGVTTLQLEAV